ncbi:type II toxin-antitoxin system VapB family antitoxin [Novosphingobium sp.]|uniref:DUF7662 domain-containing protein n=1 Tax=Novosphingobium sp. TaxID=1874826 RepID=UPI0025E1B079|nr:type II toxin-antitoxin system VapB family antitoxin [Novosphingobium sp.]
MGKYDPLARYLNQADGESIDASFAQVEAVLGFKLPDSAYRHQAWWANQTNGSHSHSRSWQGAGWDTCQVNTARRTVRFERRKSVSKQTLQKRPPVVHESSDDALIDKARDITGINDREMLVKAGLEALIQREAAAYLASLGGTMPDAKAAPRRRFSWRS